MLNNHRLSLSLLASLTLAAAGCADEPTGPDALPAEEQPVRQTAISPVGQGRIIPDQYVVTIEADADPAETAAELARRLGGEVLYVYRHALNGFAMRLPDERAPALAESPQVVRVEPDQVVEAIGQTLPAGIDRVDADANSTASVDGADDPMDVDVGILDTGIDLDHPDLKAVDAINCIESGATADDDNGHGTHVAGSAAAKDNDSHVVGAAPGASVHAVKVLDGNGSGTISSVVCGVDYVTENAGTIEVANMSLGTQGQSSSLRTAIQNSVSAGVYYAVAAGNDAEDVYGSDQKFGTDDDYIPAAYPEVAAVSAMADFDGTAGGDGGSKLFAGCGWIDDDTFAECFSNFSTEAVTGNPVVSPGAAIDLAAPGVDVLSTTNDGSTGRKTGTSMSSPHVAGAAAVEIVANGRDRDGDGDHDADDVEKIRQALIDRGQPQSDWQPGGTGDPDSNPERLVFLGESNTPPSVSWKNPTDGQTVSGTVTIQINASDSEDSDDNLTVEWQVDGGSWSTATYDSGCGCYTDSWDTTGETEGDHGLDARATDSSGSSSTASITVTVDNQDDAPTVSWLNPSDGETVSGTVDIRIAADDDRDSGSDLAVEWQVDDGTWNTASYDSGCDCYTDTWDTESVSDGDHNLDARATDTSGNTSSEARITVTVDNSGSTSDMYVWDISFRETGPHLAATVTIHQDSDGDGVAESSDDPVPDATVYFELRHDGGDGSFDCSTGEDTCQSFTGTTDSSGQVEFKWKHAPSGKYEAEVMDLTHGSLTWDSSLDADNPDYYTLQ